METADLIITLGHDITEKPPVIANDNQKIAHLNFYPADLDAVYRPTLEVIGDISHALWAVSEQLEPKEYWPAKEWQRFRQQQLEDTLVSADSDAFPIKPQRMIKDLRDVVPHGGILSLDNGMFKLWIARNYPAYEQNTVLLDNALATMGAGLGAGIGAKLLNPDKPVVVIAGDGGFMMNLADLETAIRLKLDLVILIVNDNGYGMIKWKQDSMGLADYGLNFANPDFVGLANSFGAVGHQLESAADFKPTLEKALESGGVHIINLPVDYSENVSLAGDNLRQRTQQA
jgi:acetolactate synthase-1/2/3 large subunit